MATDGTSYTPKIFRAQGGDKLVFKDGAELEFQSDESKYGRIYFPLTGMRLIASNDIPNTAATPSGGILTSNTAPALIRVNGATDKALRILWAAGSSVELAVGSFGYPADLDPAGDITVKLLARMGGTSDTPTVAVGFFEGIGDSDAGGATGALSDTLAVVSRTIATANVGGEFPTGFASITLTPGTHASDNLQLYVVWVEYLKKTVV